jgi:hypothetical protein
VRDSPSTWWDRGSRLYAQSGDQGRGVCATSKQAGCGFEVRGILVAENGDRVDIRVGYERGCGLALGVGQQIDYADGMGSGVADL